MSVNFNRGGDFAGKFTHTNKTNGKKPTKSAEFPKQDAKVQQTLDKLNRQNKKTEAAKAEKEKNKDQLSITKTDKAASSSGLSKTALAYLEKLQATYTNVNFTVAQFNEGEDVSRYATGEKKYSCVITPALLENMASDEKIAAQYEKIIEEADGKFEQAKTDLGDDAAKVKQFGVSANSEGTKYFAKLSDNLLDSDGQPTISSVEAATMEDLVAKLKDGFAEMAKKQAQITADNAEKTQETAKTDETDKTATTNKADKADKASTAKYPDKVQKAIDQGEKTLDLFRSIGGKTDGFDPLDIVTGGKNGNNANTYSAYTKKK
ncbi:MAG: DUF6033 family protein [Oscillospiraceae bacterium]|jgi:hypothetical protein|nr:DUF6033 family protein [Oscillospiraceae bacterium]